MKPRKRPRNSPGRSEIHATPTRPSSRGHIVTDRPERTSDVKDHVFSSLLSPGQPGWLYVLLLRRGVLIEVSELETKLPRSRWIQRFQGSFPTPE